MPSFVAPLLCATSLLAATPPKSPPSASPSAAPAAAAAPGEAAAAGEAPAARVTLLVLDLEHDDKLDADVAKTLTGLVVHAVGERAGPAALDVVAGEDLRKALDLEATRASLGCDTEEMSCLAEIAGAFGARYVVFGRLSQLGSTLMLRLSLSDQSSARVVGRELLRADSLDALSEAVPGGVHALLAQGALVAEASAAPEASASIAPYLLWGGAGGAAVGGLVAAGAGAWAALRYQAFREPESGSHRSSAQQDAQLAIGVTAGGAALLLVGAAALTASLFLE